eukprot:2064461-Amphidinium_carterae.1
MDAQLPHASTHHIVQLTVFQSTGGSSGHAHSSRVSQTCNVFLLNVQRPSEGLGWACTCGFPPCEAGFTGVRACTRVSIPGGDTRLGLSISRQMADNCGVHTVFIEIPSLQELRIEQDLT